MSYPRCINDGHEIIGHLPFHAPLSKDPITDKWIFDKRNFCHPSCAKCFYRRDVSLSPALLVNLELYLVKDLNMRNVPTAQDPVVLACFNVNGIGLTIEQYRNFESKEVMIEKPDFYPIDKNVFMYEQQENHKIPFEQLVRENHCLDNNANSLYKRNVGNVIQEKEDESMFDTIIDEEEEQEEVEIEEEDD